MKIFQGVNEIGSVSILSITTLQLRHREKENALNLALKTLWNTSFSWSQETFKQHFDIVLAAFWWLPLKLKNQIARSVGKQRCQLAVPQFNAQLNNFFLTWRILTEHLIQKPYGVSTNYYHYQKFKVASYSFTIARALKYNLCALKRKHDFFLIFWRCHEHKVQNWQRIFWCFLQWNSVKFGKRVINTLLVGACFSGKSGFTSV